MHVLYCDDVRQEVSNKTMLIGVYGTDLFVNEMPVVLAKLVAVISIATEASSPFESLSVKIFRDDEQVGEFPVNIKDLQDAAGPAPAPSEGMMSGPSLRIFSAIITLSPFAIEKPGVLRVIAKTESGELRGPALRISLQPAAKADGGGNNATVRETR
jgi:hypothetical protein